MKLLTTQSRNVRVLLDEHLPRRIVRELPDHQVSTVQKEGWAGVKNGPVLKLATEAGFEVFLTAQLDPVDVNSTADRAENSLGEGVHRYESDTLLVDLEIRLPV